MLETFSSQNYLVLQK